MGIALAGWLHLKNLACANQLQANIDDVVKAARKVLAAQHGPASVLHFRISRNL